MSIRDNLAKTAKGFAAGIGIISLFAILRKSAKEEAEKQAEEERRRSIPIDYSKNISKETFEKIVFEETKRVKRITSTIINGPTIICSVISRSGISEWNFSIDFNDYGNLTGKYWVSSDNSDSQIPSLIAQNISDKIKISAIEKKISK